MHGSLIPFHNPLLKSIKLLCSIFRLRGEQEIAWKPLAKNGINILVSASALRMGVLIEVNKTYMKK